MKPQTKEHLLQYLKTEEILLVQQGWLQQPQQRAMAMTSKLSLKECTRWGHSIFHMAKISLLTSQWRWKIINLIIPKKHSKIYNCKKITVKNWENRISNLAQILSLIKLIKELKMLQVSKKSNQKCKAVQLHLERATSQFNIMHREEIYSLMKQ